MNASAPVAAQRAGTSAAGPDGAADRPAGAGSLTPAPGLSATVGSEWLKLAARRSTYTLAGAGLILAVGVTVLAGVGVGTSWDHWSAADKADFNPLEYSFLGLILSGVLLMVLGVRAVSSEYGNGMIRLTLTATPKRGRLFAAKMIVVWLATAGAGVILSLAVFLVGQLIFGAYGLPTADLAQGDAIRAVILEGVLTPVYPLIGAALAIIARSTTLPLTGTLVLTFAPSVLASFLSDSWQKILRYTPGAASDALSIAHSSDSSSQSSVAVALVVIVVWLAAFLVPAYVVFGRRDA